MDVLVVGEAGFPGRDVVEAFAEAGHRVVSRDPRRRGDRAGELAQVAREAQDFDVVVDLGAESAEGVRAALEAVGPLARHYVLVSSCEVYPNVPRARPWSAEAIDLTDEPGLPTLPARTRGLRAAERELRIRGRRLAWSILRPAIVEGPGEPNPRALAYVSRILDGGPLVLPDAGLSPYRHLSAKDLGRALVAIAGKNEAFGKTLDVAGEGLLSPWGHAAMLMDGLHRRSPFTYVPAHAWRAAGLSLPYDDVACSAFVEPSRLLIELGFRPSDELAFTHELARHLAELPRAPDREKRELELRLAEEAQARNPITPGLRSESGVPARSWLLTANPGSPASLRFEPLDRIPALSPPILRTRRLALGLVERMLLAGDLPTVPGKRALGHNALLEVIEGGPTGLAPGTLCIPLAQLPCDAPACAFCREPARRVLGLDVDGYGARFTTTPLHHLVPVPENAAKHALLADPLAALAEELEAAIAQKPGPVWVCGASAEAALAGYVSSDAGQPVRHVDRMPPARSNGVFSVEPLEGSIHAVRHSQLPGPTVAIELSGSMDLARQLAFVLPPGGILLAHRRPAVLPENVVFRTLPPAAPSRRSLEAALARLARWSTFRDLAAHLGPAVPPDLAYDSLLPAPFSQPFLEEPA